MLSSYSISIPRVPCFAIVAVLSVFTPSAPTEHAACSTVYLNTTSPPVPLPIGRSPLVAKPRNPILVVRVRLLWVPQTALCSPDRGLFLFLSISYFIECFPLVVTSLFLRWALCHSGFSFSLSCFPFLSYNLSINISLPFLSLSQQTVL